MVGPYNPIASDGSALSIFRPEKALDLTPDATVSIVSTATFTFPPSGVVAVYLETNNLTFKGGAVNLTGSFPGDTVHYFSGQPGSTGVVGGSSISSSTVHVWECSSTVHVPVPSNGLATGLVESWEMEEGNGASRVGSKSAIVLVDSGGAIEQTTGIQGNGAAFTGVGGDNLVQGPAISSLLEEDTFSMEFWVDPNNLAVSTYACATFSSGSLPYFYVRLESNGSVRFLGFDGTSTAWVANSSASDITTGGGWHHIVVTRVNSGTAYIYVDGAEVASDSATNGTTDFATDYAGTQSFSVGALPVGTSAIDADLDSVRYWDRVLTPAEVTALYSGGAGLPYSGLT